MQSDILQAMQVDLEPAVQWQYQPHLHQQNLQQQIQLPFAAASALLVADSDRPVAGGGDVLYHEQLLHQQSSPTRPLQLYSPAAALLIGSSQDRRMADAGVEYPMGQLLQNLLSEVPTRQGRPLQQQQQQKKRQQEPTEAQRILTEYFTALNQCQLEPRSNRSNNKSESNESKKDAKNANKSLHEWLVKCFKILTPGRRAAMYEAMAAFRSTYTNTVNLQWHGPFISRQPEDVQNDLQTMICMLMMLDDQEKKRNHSALRDILLQCFRGWRDSKLPVAFLSVMVEAGVPFTQPQVEAMNTAWAAWFSTKASISNKETRRAQEAAQPAPEVSASLARHQQPFVQQPDGHPVYGLPDGTAVWGAGVGVIMPSQSQGLTLPSGSHTMPRRTTSSAVATPGHAVFGLQGPVTAALAAPGAVGMPPHSQGFMPPGPVTAALAANGAVDMPPHSQGFMPPGRGSGNNLLFRLNFENGNEGNTSSLYGMESDYMDDVIMASTFNHSMGSNIDDDMAGDIGNTSASLAGGSGDGLAGGGASMVGGGVTVGAAANLAGRSSAALAAGGDAGEPHGDDSSGTESSDEEKRAGRNRSRGCGAPKNAQDMAAWKDGMKSMVDLVLSVGGAADKVHVFNSWTEEYHRMNSLLGKFTQEQQLGYIARRKELTAAYKNAAKVFNATKGTE